MNVARLTMAVSLIALGFVGLISGIALDRPF